MSKDAVTHYCACAGCSGCGPIVGFNVNACGRKTDFPTADKWTVNDEGGFVCAECNAAGGRARTD
jgi:hypothetical protein